MANIPIHPAVDNGVKPGSASTADGTGAVLQALLPGTVARLAARTGYRPAAP